jgi:hypothetical protein
MEVTEGTEPAFSIFETQRIQRHNGKKAFPIIE